MTVTDIYIFMRLEQSAASQHLAILRGVDALTTRRDGKHIFYKLNRSYLDLVLSKLDGLPEPYWPEKNTER